MDIEDPIAAIQALNASDERQASPISAFTKDFLRIVKLWSKVCAPPAALAVEGVEAAAEWVSRWRQTNRNELIDVMADELQRHEARFKRLLASTAEHRRFMEEEMPGLVMEALRRAEQARAKDRIKRLASIVIHSVQSGPRDGADYVEEMMRIAMELTGRDVHILGAMYRAFACHIVPGTGVMPHLIAVQHWRFGVDQWFRVNYGEILSACLKLESYGLVQRSEDRTQNNLSDEPLPFRLLQKGKDLFEYIRSSAESA